jgi:uncharacterized protein (UPF0332 family)
MPVSPQHFFDLAGKLVLQNQKGEEIEHRTSINRAYYALYLRAREIAKNLPELTGKNASKLGSHEKVIAKFEQEPKLKRIAYLIAQRKSKRCDADYETKLPITYTETEKHYNSVKDLLAKLSNVQI